MLSEFHLKNHINFMCGCAVNCTVLVNNVIMECSWFGQTRKQIPDEMQHLNC